MPRGRPKKILSAVEQAEVTTTTVVKAKPKKSGVIEKHIPKTKPEKISKIDTLLDTLSKKYEVEDGNAVERMDSISSGSILLDEKLGDHGFIRGKIIENYGMESIGKTALGWTLAAQTKGITAYIDCESNYDKKTTEMYGVDTSRIKVLHPVYIEEAMEMTLDYALAGVELIIFDSIAGIAPKVELEGSMEDSNIGKKATRMGQFMRRLHNICRKSGTIVYFINQTRQNVGNPYDPITTQGGNALKFQATYRLYAMSKEKIERVKGEPPIGHYIRLKIVKNKFEQPDIVVKIPLIYGRGINKEWEVIDLALEKDVIVKAGSWLSYDGTNLAQGQYNTCMMLIDNPELYEEIKSKL